MSSVSLVLLVGGARAGKSSIALRLAAAAGAPVTFVATAAPGDEEMAARIERHRRERPSAWSTVEEPVEIEAAVAGQAPDHTVVLDCLTLWVANVLERGGSDDDVRAAAGRTAAAAAGRPGLTVAVTNEVGSGIVPADPLSRRYRDLLGSVNAVFADHADRAYLVVAGRTLDLQRSPSP